MFFSFFSCGSFFGVGKPPFCRMGIVMRAYVDEQHAEQLDQGQILQDLQEAAGYWHLTCESPELLPGAEVCPEIY
jgi:hypothetical protein